MRAVARWTSKCRRIGNTPRTRHRPDQSLTSTVVIQVCSAISHRFCHHGSATKAGSGKMNFGRSVRLTIACQTTSAKRDAAVHIDGFTAQPRDQAQNGGIARIRFDGLVHSHLSAHRSGHPNGCAEHFRRNGNKKGGFSEALPRASGYLWTDEERIPCFICL